MPLSLARQRHTLQVLQGSGLQGKTTLSQGRLRPALHQLLGSTSPSHNSPLRTVLLMIREFVQLGNSILGTTTHLLAHARPVQHQRLVSTMYPVQRSAPRVIPRKQRVTPRVELGSTGRGAMGPAAERVSRAPQLMPLRYTPMGVG